MNVVRENVEKLVGKELEAATERFGLHHSWHEKYAVTLEELQELKEEVTQASSDLESVWFGIRNNFTDYTEERIRCVYEDAVKAACEAIQVAAMCKKEIENDA